jgi:hypothetical protein
MFNQPHFYHRIIRKMVVAFGTMFNDVRLVRYNKAGTTEIERINVPLQYAQKEKFYQRITQDSTLSKPIELTLPRMSFELASVSYDPLRKRSLFVESFSAGTTGTSVKTIRTTPYNFDFELNIYVRNTEDGTQIIEQILPYFNPDYTMTIDFIGLNDQKVDIPFILNNINYNVEDLGGPDPVRSLIWNLTFTAKGYMYGPIISQNIIRKVTANTFNSVSTPTGQRVITVANTGGSGTFKTGELVYEGATLSAANATAFVESWNANTRQLVVVDTNGVLSSGKYIYGAVSNAAYNIASFTTNDNQLQLIQITPNPSTANANTAFGFDELVKEFPNIV